MNYWKSHLKDYENLNIMTDKPRPLENDFIGKIVSKKLDRCFTKSLKNLSKDGTMNTTSIDILNG